uniref:Peptidase C1A papain C-terminal domain-containing protein n=1 Tax=Oryza glumipatula TaxID=40148 RepID=A0A0D9Y831_9ORYZ
MDGDGDGATRRDTTHGERPVTVYIDASGPAFQFYRSGVFPGPCGASSNHAVTLVGYCQDGASGKKYWLAKNSWGKTWGQQGYILLEKDVLQPYGTCGLAVSPFYPTCTDQTSSPTLAYTTHNYSQVSSHNSQEGNYS